MSKFRSRAIIPYNDGIILIHRIKNVNGKINEYYVFPGGGVEENETPEECVLRENFEELGITIKVVNELYRLNNNDETEIFFLCEYVDGEIGTGDGPEFHEKDRGEYIPCVVKISDIYGINIIEEIKQALKRDLGKYSCFGAIPKRQL